MAGVLERLTKRFDRFFPKNKNDPRCADQSMTGRPLYHLGEGWTPTNTQIAEARERQQARRANPATRWRQLTAGPEFEAARAVGLCATDLEFVDEAARRRNRKMRFILFDEHVEIFVRNLRISPDRFLMEVRHPLLAGGSLDAPIGLRFLGLSASAWSSHDYLGLALDGSRAPIAHLFAQNFERTVEDPDLTEAYVRFVFDHVESAGEQTYIVSDSADFVASHAQPAFAGDQIDVSLTAQFRVNGLPDTADGPDGWLARALCIPENALVPPTVLRIESKTTEGPAYAVVFVTLVCQGRLEHACLKVFSDGRITPTEHRHGHTPPDITLPLVPIRSLNAQRAALRRACDGEGGEEAL